MEQWNRDTGVYHDLALLRQAVWSGRVAPAPRGLLWKVLLVYRTLDQTKWRSVDKAIDARYEELRGVFGDQISSPASEADEADPLSGPKGSEGDFIDVINADVDRTFPEMDFFRTHSVQKSLCRILYYYAKLNPDVGYRQGMHELLAPVLYSVLKDPVPNCHIEATTFAIFEAIMKPAKPWYLPTTGHGSVPGIVEESRAIEDVLRVCDPPVYELLAENEIEPQIWGIKWIRLLFGREFDFDTMLQLWDAMFAADETLSLVRYVAAVMVIRIRGQLLKSSSNTDVLALLLDYPSRLPSDENVPYDYVLNALYLRRNVSLEGGRYVANQYKSLWYEEPPARSKINLEGFVEAARSVGQRLDIDKRFRDAKSALRLSPSPVSHERRSRISSPTTSHRRRDGILSAVLSEALESLVDITGHEDAMTKIRQVRDCLRDPSHKLPSPANLGKPVSPEKSVSPTPPKERFGGVLTREAQSPVTKPKEHREALPIASLSTSSRAKKTSLAQSEYSWMLGDSDASPKQKKQPKEDVNDPFFID